MLNDRGQRFVYLSCLISLFGQFFDESRHCDFFEIFTAIASSWPSLLRYQVIVIVLNLRCKFSSTPILQITFTICDSSGSPLHCKTSVLFNIGIVIEFLWIIHTALRVRHSLVVAGDMPAVPYDSLNSRNRDSRSIITWYFLLHGIVIQVRAIGGRFIDMEYWGGKILPLTICRVHGAIELTHRLEGLEHGIMLVARLLEHLVTLDLDQSLLIRMLATFRNEVGGWRALFGT